MRVVWLCRRCPQPVTFTAHVEYIRPGEHKVHATPHIHAHMRQHQ